eukprot:UN02404
MGVFLKLLLTIFNCGLLILLWCLMAEQLPYRKMSLSVFQFIYTVNPVFLCFPIIWWYSKVNFSDNFSDNYNGICDVLACRAFRNKEILGSAFLMVVHNVIWPFSLKHTAPATNTIIYFAYPMGVTIFSVIFYVVDIAG